MKNVRLLASLLALVMSVSILAACGDTETVSSEGGTSSTASLPSINISSVGAPSNVVSLPEPAETVTLVEKGAEFQCKTLTTEEFNTSYIENVNVRWTPGKDFKNLRSEADFQLVPNRKAQSEAIETVKNTDTIQGLE